MTPINEVELTETGGAKLSRVLRHMTRPFAIISAFRGDDHRANLQKTVALTHDLLNMGLGGIAMTGHWGDVPEKSFFVPIRDDDTEGFMEMMRDLGHKYDQEAVMLGDGNKIWFDYMDDRPDELVGDAATMDAEKLKGGYSRVKKRDFIVRPKDDEEGLLDPKKLGEEIIDEGDVVPIPANTKPVDAMTRVRGGEVRQIIRRPDMASLDEFTQGYIACALWLADEELEVEAVYDELAPQAIESMVEDCRSFQEENGDALRVACNRHDDSEQRAGHDFWLTRNGHGAGYWDRGLGNAGEALSEAAKRCGETDLYVGDDQLIYTYP